MQCTVGPALSMHLCSPCSRPHHRHIPPPPPRSYASGLVGQQLYTLVPQYLCHLRQQLRERLFVQLVDTLTDAVSEEEQQAVCQQAAAWFAAWHERQRQRDEEEAAGDAGGLRACTLAESAAVLLLGELTLGAGCWICQPSPGHQAGCGQLPKRLPAHSPLTTLPRYLCLAPRRAAPQRPVRRRAAR